MNHYITGHNLIQPKAIDAPLEFTQDADILAKCQQWQEQRRRDIDAEAAEKSLAELGIKFHGGAK